MNVTYKDLKEGYILKRGDTIIIHGVKYIANINSNYSFLGFDSITDALESSRCSYFRNNCFIFKLLHIEDKEEFVKEIAGSDYCNTDGCFPEVKTAEALTKVAIALLEKPLYKIGDYVTVREKIDGYEYSLNYLKSMQELARETFYVKEFRKRDDFDRIVDGEIYHYKLSGGYWWNVAMIMPATEEEKKSVSASDKKEPEKKDKEEIHFVTLENLKCGYVFKETDHISINGLDCVIHTRKDDGTRFWISSDTFLEREIYESLGMSDEKKKELASLCGAVDVNYTSPEFGNLESLSNFVKKILMYKKEDEAPSTKKWSGNPTYFDLIDGRILEKNDILNIHGIEYRVSDGGSGGKDCWLTATRGRNSAIFEKLGIEDRYAFVKCICPIVNTAGAFPEVGSHEDLTKVVTALFQVPEFKVGDKVKVAHREGDKHDYPWSFSDEMASLKDKVYTIKRIDDIVIGDIFEVKANERISNDPHCYHLDTDGRAFSWHSSMLEKVSETKDEVEKPSQEESAPRTTPINLSDLLSGYILKAYDAVVLCGDTYKVYKFSPYFLYNISGGKNYSVFDKLGIKDKLAFCSSYGRVRSGAFPEFENLRDLTACVKQLMLLEQSSLGSGDASACSLPEFVACKSIDFATYIGESDEPSDTGIVRLPEIKDDFKIIIL